MRLGSGITGTRSAAAASAVYALLVVAFTILGVAFAPIGAQVGGARPLGSIPLHLILLVAFGAAMSTATMLAAGRLDLPLALSIPAAVVLTDLDHIPSFLGLQQPIRPAHSLVFAAVAFATIAMALRNPALGAATLSGFFAHLSVDSGLFPPFAPLSFSYYDLSQLKVAMAALSLVLAVCAGLFARRRAST